MWAIKEYKELIEVVVKSKNWNDVYLFPKEDYDKLKQEMRKESHIEVAPYTLVNKFDVSTRLIEVDDMTSQIMLKQRDVQKKLRKILKERNDNNKETTCFRHLWDIYKEKEWVEKEEEEKTKILTAEQRAAAIKKFKEMKKKHFKK